MTATRWVVLVIAALLIVALIAWARGLDHQKGDEVGEEALRTTVELTV
jgi:lipopolysaccharide export system protein LptC